MPIDENAAWQQLRPGHRRADTVSAPAAGVLDRRSTSRAARNYVSTDLKGVAMKASAISLMGVRGATPAAPSPRRGGYRQAVSAATGSLNVNRRGNATKPRLTGADAFDSELFAAHSVPRDDIPRLMHRPKGGRRQDHSLALGPRTYIHRSPVILA